MAIRLNLVFLNGTFPPDIPGEFTHLGPASNSVIDYLLISANLAVNVLSFQVENQHFSDHLPIVTTLSLFRYQKDYKHSVPLETSSATKISGIKWSEAVAQKYQDFFHREITAYLPQIATDLQDSNSVLKFLTFLQQTLPLFYITSSKARSLLRSIYNEYKNSNAQALPSSYLQAKRAYKQTLKLAKREWYLKRWRALIAASRSRRPQEFWALINKRGRKYPLTIIPAPTWEQFLSKYFSLAEESNSSTEFRADHLPLWPSTDPDLIMDLILDLKTESVSPSPPETPHVCEQRSHTSGVKDCIIGDGHLEASLWLLAVQLAQASQPLPFQCLWRDDFVNPWVGKIHAKLLSIGISPADSLKMNLRSAKRLIEQRLADIENQHNLAGVRVSAPPGRPLCSLLLLLCGTGSSSSRCVGNSSHVATPRSVIDVPKPTELEGAKEEADDFAWFRLDRLPRWRHSKAVPESEPEGSEERKEGTSADERERERERERESASKKVY
ncbi:Hypothetical predicted protein [Podarcis lilfordi]|uniref:Endonuclease/exonuclease/phosphatase domain-containing protein n=1 Tax=Podarcis lilfordi TaxID=74358 RepID=A0AA35PIA3_9SAUR|nr:Hypothetical predicted protein [Podarcis lilfordi]